MQQSNDPLNYQNAKGPGKRSWSQFYLGLLVGSVVSLVVWPLAWRGEGNVVPVAIIAILIGKVVVSAVCIISGNWRSVGAGILTSLGVGFLIFFSTCFFNVANHI